MRLQLLKGFFLTGSVLASATMAPPVMAQETAATDAGLGDIVVTANRTEQSIQKAPVAVSAFSGETLDRLQVRNARDISQIAPNVQIVGVTGGSAGITPFIRGGGVTDGANVTSEPEVGIYIDDVYQPRAAASFIEALDIERVEVLRGPQGTLYGRNSSAGALKFVTRLPGEDFGGKAEIGYGSWDEVYGKGSVSGPLTSDGSLRAGISGILRDRKAGRQYNATLRKDVGAEEFQGVQGDLYYEGSTVTARLKAFYSNYSSDGLYPVSIDPTRSGEGYKAVQPYSGDYRTVLSPTQSFTRSRQYGSSLNLKADLSDTLKVTSITGWSHLTDDWSIDFSGGVPANVIGIPSSAPIALFDRTSLSTAESFSQELQLQGSALDGLVTFVSGLYYFRETGHQQINSSIYFTPSSSRLGVKTDSYAAFGQIGLHPTDELTITLGGRYMEDRKSLDAFIAGGPVVRSDTFRDFLPKIGIDYQITPRLMAYISYSEGFKAGGYNGLASSALELSSPFRPQKVSAYEIGLKTEFLDRRARLNISAFINDYASIQQQLVTTSGQFITQNYAAQHKGVEVEFNFRPLKPLNLWANGVYNDAAYKQGSGALADSPYVGNEMTNVFKYQMTGGADLELPVGPGDFLLGGNINIRADYFTTPDNLYIGHIPATTLIDAYVGYRVNNWTLRLQGKNMTDQRYWTTGFGFANIWPRFMAEPRTWRLSLSTSF